MVMKYSGSLGPFSSNFRFTNFQRSSLTERARFVKWFTAYMMNSFNKDMKPHKIFQKTIGTIKKKKKKVHPWWYAYIKQRKTKKKKLYNCIHFCWKLVKLRLTSFEGNPSMPEFILELTASSFIDRNCKSNVWLKSQPIEERYK